MSNLPKHPPKKPNGEKKLIRNGYESYHDSQHSIELMESPSKQKPKVDSGSAKNNEKYGLPPKPVNRIKKCLNEIHNTSINDSMRTKPKNDSNSKAFKSDLIWENRNNYSMNDVNDVNCSIKEHRIQDPKYKGKETIKEVKKNVLPMKKEHHKTESESQIRTSVTEFSCNGNESNQRLKHVSSSFLNNTMKPRVNQKSGKEKKKSELAKIVKTQLFSNTAFYKKLSSNLPDKISSKGNQSLQIDMNNSKDMSYDNIRIDTQFGDVSMDYLPTTKKMATNKNLNTLFKKMKREDDQIKQVNIPTKVHQRNSLQNEPLSGHLSVNKSSKKNTPIKEKNTQIYTPSSVKLNTLQKGFTQKIKKMTVKSIHVKKQSRKSIKESSFNEGQEQEIIKISKEHLEMINHKVNNRKEYIYDIHEEMNQSANYRIGCGDMSKFDIDTSVAMHNRSFDDRLESKTDNKTCAILVDMTEQDTRDTNATTPSIVITTEELQQENDNEKEEAIGMQVKVLKGNPLCSGLINSIEKQFKNKVKSESDGYQTLVSHYELIKKVGKGTFGTVHLGKQVLTGATVAIKVIERKNIEKDENIRHKIESELTILKKVSSSNCSRVVSFLEVFETKNYCFIVTEYATRGDLLTLIKRNELKGEKCIKPLFRDIIIGVSQLHQSSMVHRDLKPDNILIEENGRIKIGDVGLACQLSQGEKISDICGTPVYQAPETFGDKPYDGFSSDIWSLGIILYQMMYGKVPLVADNVEEMGRIIQTRNIQIPSQPETSAAFKDLLNKLLLKDPTRRINLEEVKSHLWFDSELQDAFPQDDIDPRKKRIALNYVENSGFSRNFIIESLKAKQHNHATACYRAFLMSISKDKDQPLTLLSN